MQTGDMVWLTDGMAPCSGLLFIAEGYRVP